MLFPIFCFLNQTNLETDLNLCQTELEADLEKMETLNKAPSTNLSQVFLSFSHALGPLCSLLCSVVFDVVGVMNGYAGYF